MCADSLFESVQYSKNWIPNSAKKDIFFRIIKGLKKDIDGWESDVLAGRYDKKNRAMKGLEGKGSKIIKLTVPGAWKLAVKPTKKCLILVTLSSHDNQIRDIKNSDLQDLDGSQRPGYITISRGEFFDRIDFLAQDPKLCHPATLRRYMMSDLDYELDADQEKAVMEYHNSEHRNIIITGNAGAGKSSTGYIWLVKSNRAGKRLYLTMSENLCKEYEKQHEADRKLHDISKIDFCPIFSYIKRIASQIDGIHQLLDPEQSWREFKKVCSEITVGWNSMPGIETKGKVAWLWRVIHGLLKGSLSERENLNVNTWSNFHKDNLTQAELWKAYARYMKKQQSVDIALAFGKRFTNFLWQVYGLYEKHLSNIGALDDNDTARLILTHTLPEVNLYDAVVIDECQDLTEIQIATLFKCLQSCRQRFIASDRCQMVRPTYFNTGFMRQIVESFDVRSNKQISNQIAMMHNYRSTNQITDLQNLVLKEMAKYHNFTQEERHTVTSTIIDNGVIPYWIVDNKCNREALKKLHETFAGEGLRGRLINIYAHPHEEAMDIVTCKGQGFKAVLLVNVFFDESQYINEQDPLAWDYFYVGITRAEKYLFIIEPENTNLGKCLCEWDIQGKVKKCLQLENSTCLQDIDTIVRREITQNDVTTQAIKMVMNGNYRQALPLLVQQENENTECMIYIYLCKGHIAEEEERYDDAIREYMEYNELNADNQIDAKSDLARLSALRGVRPISRFAAKLYLVSDEGEELKRIEALDKIYEEYKLSIHVQKGILDIIEDTYEEYPTIRNKIDKWFKALFHSYNEKMITIQEKMMRGTNYEQ